MGASLYFTLASVAALIGVAIVLWALLGDRSRGRPRCPKCWYSMQGAASRRCPECGHEVKRDRHLYRARRRWKGACAGLLLLLGSGGGFGYVAIQPTVQDHGWQAVVPTTALLMAFEFSDDPWLVEAMELHTADADDLWVWQWRWLGRHALRRVEQERNLYRYSSYVQWMMSSANISGSERLQERAGESLDRLYRHDRERFQITAITVGGLRYIDAEAAIERLLGRLGEGPDQWHQSTVSSITTALSFIARHDRRAFEALVALLDHEHATVRAEVVPDLARVGTRYGYYDEAYERIEAMLGAPAGEVRERAVERLAEMEHDQDESWRILETALESDDVHARRGAFKHLRSFAFLWSRSDLAEEVTPYVYEALNDEDSDIQRIAIHLAAQWPHGHGRLDQHAGIVIGAVHHRDETVRESAETLLERLDDEILLTHLDALVEAAGHDHVDSVVWRRLRDLARDHRDGFDALVSLLSHDEAAARVRALDAIRATASNHQIRSADREAMQAMMQDSSGLVRRHAVQTLAAISDGGEAWAFIADAMQSEDRSIRSGAFRWAHHSESPPDEIIPAVIDGLRDSDDLIRIRAFILADRLDVELRSAHRETLKSMLDHHNPFIRSSAGRIFEERASPNEVAR